MMRVRPSRPRSRITALCLAAALMLASLVLALLASQASAKDLGVRGATWAVAEPDLLVQIEARLAAMQRSGEMARFEVEAPERARGRLEKPEPVAGIAPALARRSWTFDPSIEVARDIRAHDGMLIAAAGTRIDPFRYAPLTRDLLFVDGRRDAEIAWALGHARPSKIVLLAGRPLELARRHGRAFFYDQGGRLAARFGIAATPSLVVPDGAHLRITEIPLDEFGRDSSNGDQGVPVR